jgi:hypothetical protein
VKLIPLLCGAALTILTRPAAAMPAAVGSVANNIGFCTGTTLTANRFATLTNSNYAALEGKIIVLGYYTPW